MGGESVPVSELLNIQFYGYLFGFENLWFTETLRNTWIIGGFMILAAVLLRLNMKNWNPDKPTGIQNAVEAVVDAFHGYVKAIMGEEYTYFGNYFFTVFFLLLFSNLAGLVLLRNPTADITFTFAFSILTFVTVHLFGMIKSKGKYFKSFIEPHWSMLPLNLIGEIAPVISLAMRIFGVVVGGFIISVLLYNVAPWPLRLGFPIIVHGYFDIFGGVLHAFLFLTLSMVFIRGKLPD